MTAARHTHDGDYLGGRLSAWTIFICLLALTAALPVSPAAATTAPAPGVRVGATPLHWLHPDRGFVTRAGMADANGDGVDDVVTASGDRPLYWQWLVPPSNPSAAVDQASDYALRPAAKLAMLDGRTGEQIWTVTWRPEEPAAGPPSGDVLLLEDVVVGDADDDGSDDILVLRSIVAPDMTRTVQHTSLYDAATGEVLWEESTTRRGLIFRQIAPADVPGRPGAVLTAVTISQNVDDNTFDFATRMQVLALSPDSPPSTLVELRRDGALYPVAQRHGDGLRLFVAHWPDLHPLNAKFLPLAEDVDIAVFDVVAEGTERARIDHAWSREGMGGILTVLDGPNPLVVSAADELVALDADDGTERWRAPIDLDSNAGYTGKGWGYDTLAEYGRTLATDADGDGTQDLVVSPHVSDDPNFGTDVVLLNGRDGAEIWRVNEAMGKTGAFALTLADVTGDGKPELGVSAQHRDYACNPLWCTWSPTHEQGIVSVLDLADGARRCLFSTDSAAMTILSAELDGEGGEELVLPGVRGSVYAVRAAAPGCGVLTSIP